MRRECLTFRTQHPISLPEKPALEGLEAKWNARWEADGDLSLRPQSFA